MTIPDSCIQCNTLTGNSLRSHVSRIHKPTVTIKIGEVETTISRLDSGEFVCPYCDSTLRRTDIFQRHVQGCSSSTRTSDDNVADDTDSDNEVEAADVQLPVEPVLPTNVSVSLETTTASQRRQTRSHRAATLSAMGASNHSVEQQNKMMLTAELGDLHPVAFFDSLEKERNVLAHSSVISKIISSKPEHPTTFTAIPPAKRIKIEEDDVNDDHDHASLFHLISGSTLSHHLKAKDYMEMDETVGTIMNTDWTRRPWMRVVCARALEGLILMNGTEGLLVNCAEVYCRQPTLDAHHERTFAKRNQPLYSTLPTYDTKYSDVQLFAVNNDNSKKLELGTKTMNALFTSTVRLDKDSSVAIGPSSLNDFDVSTSTTIFVRKGFMLWYQNLIAGGCKNLVVQSLYSFDELSQLRQVRSKFNKASTYRLARSSSFLTNDICHRPATIWTLADKDSNTPNDSDGKNASLLFQALAMAVWDDADDAKLDGKVVTQLMRKSKKGGKVWELLNAIDISMLLETSKTMSIIGNDDLNRILVSLADLLSPYILKSNIKITSAINQRLLQ